MSDETIDRIRSATFNVSRRGYEKREVDRFLTRLAEWLETGGIDDVRSGSVKRELERVGEKTASILSTAEDTAQGMRAEAEAEAESTLRAAKDAAKKVRGDADDYARTARAEAEEYSGQVRGDADAYAEQTRGEAEAYAGDTKAKAEKEAEATIKAGQAKSERIIADGEKRRRDIEAVIADLVGRRNAVLKAIERLDAELRNAVSEHQPRKGDDPFAAPDDLDPGEGDGEKPPNARRGAKQGAASTDEQEVKA